MPTYVTLFAATEEELDRLFPDWSRPAAQPVLQRAEDLFTGREVTVKRWVVPHGTAPASRLGAIQSDAQPIAPVLPAENAYEQKMEQMGPCWLRSLPHACLQNLFADHLRLLANLLVGIETDARPERLTSDGRSIDSLPHEAVLALAQRSADELPLLASQWAAEETAGFDAESDALWALRRIHVLAQECTQGERRALCLWMDVDGSGED